MKKEKYLYVKKICVFLLLTLMISNNTLVYADNYEVSGNYNTSKILGGSPCGNEYLTCMSISEIPLARISFIDKDGKYMKITGGEKNGEELRIIEVEDYADWGGNDKEGFYDEYTLTNKENSNKNFFQITSTIKRLRQDGTSKRLTGETISYDEILEIDTNGATGNLQLGAPYRIKDYLGENFNKKQDKKQIFKGRSFNFRDLLYVWSHMSKDKCNHNSTKTNCDNEFNKWADELDKIENGTSQYNKDYEHFIEDAYIMIEPYFEYTPAITGYTELGEKVYGSDLKSKEKRTYYFTAMDFAIKEKNTPLSKVGWSKDGEKYKTIETNFGINDSCLIENHLDNNSSVEEIQKKCKYECTIIDTVPIVRDGQEGRRVNYKCVKGKSSTGNGGTITSDEILANSRYVYSVAQRKFETDLKYLQTWPIDNGWLTAAIMCSTFISESPNNMTIPKTECKASTEENYYENNSDKTKVVFNDEEAQSKNNPERRYWNLITENGGLNSYGMVIFKVKEESKTTDPINKTCDINVKECEEGTFGINTNFSQECVDNVEEFKTNLENTYCYDSQIEFDFHDTYAKLNNLNSNSIKPSMYLEIPDGKLTIQRKCYTDGSQDKDSVMNITKPKFNKGNATISLNLLNNNYTFEAENLDEISNSYSEEIKDGRKIMSFTYAIPLKFKYTIANFNNTILIPNNIAAGTYDGTLRMNGNNIVKIKDISIMNSTILTKTQNNDFNTTSKNGTINLTYKKNNDYNFSCSIKTTVEPGIPPVPRTKEPPNNVQFRIISLEHPFPGKDGNSRIPGTNWLNENNYVYKYITNNRNIQIGSEKIKNPEMIYLERSPIYTITLNASNMIKIREYNKTNSYQDMNLKCIDGRMCLSSFLRNEKYSLNMSGLCQYGGFENHLTMYSTLAGIGEQEQYGTPISVLDFNKDGIFNSSDRVAVYQEIDKKYGSGTDKILSDYYYCADKDSMSGG